MHGADGLLSLAPVQLRASSGELAWLSTAGQLTFGKLDKAQQLRNSAIGQDCLGACLQQRVGTVGSPHVQACGRGPVLCLPMTPAEAP